jgi:hypothetical protein
MSDVGKNRCIIAVFRRDEDILQRISEDRYRAAKRFVEFFEVPQTQRRKLNEDSKKTRRLKENSKKKNQRKLRKTQQRKLQEENSKTQRRL